MNFLATLNFAQVRKSPLTGLVLFVFGILGAYEIAGYIIAGDMTGLGYAALAVLLAAIIVAVLNNWRNGLYFFVAWLFFEDFARKYLGNNMAIFFAKDVLVAVVYLSFYVSYRRRSAQSFRPPFLIPLLVFVWFGIIQAFNPASTSLWYGALGVKLFFFYVPLLFVGYALVDSEAQLRRFFSVNLLLALVVVSLGIAQSILGHTFMNPPHPAEDIRELSTLYRAAPISGAVLYRPTSVFVSDGRFANFLRISWLLILGFSGYLLLRRRSGRILAFIALAVTAAGCALCGSRGVFAWSIINTVVAALAFLWGAPWRQREVVRVLRTIQRAALGIVLALALLAAIFPDALAARLAMYSETLSPTSSASELGFRAWDYPLQNFLGAFGYPRWPYGYGIGTTSLGTQYVARIFHQKQPVIGVESGFGTLVVEMGAVGLVLWFVMGAAIVISAWRVVKKLRGSPWFPLGFVILWYTFILLFPFTFGGMQSYEDYLLNAYLWLLLGILFRLPTIALSAEFAAPVPARQPRRRWIR